MVAAVLAAAPAGAADPVMIAVGDVACDPADTGFTTAGHGNRWTPRRDGVIRSYTSDLAVAARPALTNVLALGDLQYENGALAQVQRLLRPQPGAACATITKPVPGNHEYGASGSDFDANATGYFDLLPRPARGRGPGRRQSPAGLVQLRRPGREHQLAHRRPELRVRGRPARPGGLGRRLRCGLRAGAVAASGPGRERQRLHARLLAPPTVQLGQRSATTRSWRRSGTPSTTDYADVVLARTRPQLRALGAGRPDGRRASRAGAFAAGWSAPAART